MRFDFLIKCFDQETKKDSYMRSKLNGAVLREIKCEFNKVNLSQANLFELYSKMGVILSRNRSQSMRNDEPDMSDVNYKDDLIK